VYYACGVGVNCGGNRRILRNGKCCAKFGGIIMVLIRPFEKGDSTTMLAPLC